MRIKIPLMVAILLLMASCKTTHRKPATKPPPLPPGEKFALVKPPPPPTPLPLVVPAPAFRITNAVAKNGLIEFGWQDGTNSGPPYMVQSHDTMTGPWVNAGPATATHNFIAPLEGRDFFRVQSRYPTLHITNSQPRLSWDEITVMPNDYIDEWEVRRLTRNSSDPDPGSAPFGNWADPTNRIAPPLGTFGTPFPITSQNYSGDNSSPPGGQVYWYDVKGATHGEDSGATTATQRPNLSIVDLAGGSFRFTSGDADAGKVIRWDTGEQAIVTGVYPGTSGAQINIDRVFSPAPTGQFTVRVLIPQNRVSWSQITPGTVRWSKTISGTGFHGAVAVTVDSSGNIYTVGAFQGDVTLAGSSALTSAGGTDFWISKHNPDGSLIWKNRYGGSAGNEIPNCIAVDGSGNIAIGGKFYFTANFGGIDHTSHGDADAFVAKYDSSGNWVWDVVFGSSRANGVDEIRGIAMDSSGNVIASGQIATIFQEVIKIGGINKTFYYSAKNVVLVKFDATDGHALWIAPILTQGGASYPLVAVDRRDDSIVLSGSGSSIILGGDEFGSGGTPYSGNFLSKWSSAGALLMSRDAGGAGPDPFAVNLDSNGDIVVTGKLVQSADFGGGTISGGGVVSSSYVVKYAGTDLAHQWSFPIRSQNQINANAVTMDAARNVIVAGAYYGSCDCYDASRTIKKSLPNTGSGNSSDALVVKYTTAGVFVWGQNYGTSDSDVALGAAITSGTPVVLGKIYLADVESFLMGLIP